MGENPRTACGITTAGDDGSKTKTPRTRIRYSIICEPDETASERVRCFRYRDDSHTTRLPSSCVETIDTYVQHERISKKPGYMKRVVIHELVPDMVLARPVTNANGLPIVAAGTSLDAALIERLRQMELPSVYVEGDDLDAGGKTLEELEVELDHRFRYVVKDPIQQLILRTLRTHLRTTHGTTPDIEKPEAA